MTPRRVNLWKDKEVVYDVPLRDIRDIDFIDFPLKANERECACVGLKYSTPRGRYFVVYADDLGRLFPARWKPA